MSDVLNYALLGVMFCIVGAIGYSVGHDNAEHEFASEFEDSLIEFRSVNAQQEYEYHAMDARYWEYVQYVRSNCSCRVGMGETDMELIG